MLEVHNMCENPTCGKRGKGTRERVIKEEYIYSRGDMNEGD